MKIEIFDDKFSIGHFVLGALTPLYPKVFLIFLFYEMIEFIYKHKFKKKREKVANFLGDLTEYFWGNSFIFLFLYL